MSLIRFSGEGCASEGRWGVRWAKVLPPANSRADQPEMDESTLPPASP
ncbi:hypothetical protein BV133_96 [Blastochloris viridis]|uniref:Uncharacterized protein n=1 Tax=Blastochloris viridis TaxID=1079 RepID=A0A182DUX5_BLAVI|nr:hypothetical protein BV133_96 [Blastochloris viridis]